MADLTVSRKQRARTLVEQIREGMEEFYHVGMKLKELRDDKLYKELGYENFEKCCRAEFDYSKSYASELISSAQLRAKLPSFGTAEQSWTERSVNELKRIGDDAEAARVAKKILKEVEKEDGPKITSTTVRKFVDEELGVTKPKPEVKPKDEGPNLAPYLSDLQGQIEGTLEAIQVFDNDAWKHFMKIDAGTVKRLIAACESMAAFLRKVGRG